jgi:hypothetical protein
LLLKARKWETPAAPLARKGLWVSPPFKEVGAAKRSRQSHHKDIGEADNPLPKGLKNGEYSLLFSVI